jgi:hypothetical protein
MLNAVGERVITPPPQQGKRPRVAPADGDGRPPPELPGFAVGVDEGPMRRDLLRQIRWLEQDYAAACAARLPQPTDAANPGRGPALLSAAQLEQVRDELLSALARLHRED